MPRFHEPAFNEHSALYIIWTDDAWTRRPVSLLATTELDAANASMRALAASRPERPLRLQHGARVMRRHDPETVSDA